MAIRKRTSDVMLRKREKFGRKEISERRIDICNGGFETGNYTCWTVFSNGLSYAVVNTESPPEGLWSSKFWGGTVVNTWVLMSQAFSPAYPPTKIYFQYKFSQTFWNSALVQVIDKDWNYLLNQNLALAPVWTPAVFNISSGTGAPYTVFLTLVHPDGELHVDDVYFTG